VSQQAWYTLLPTTTPPPGPDPDPDPPSQTWVFVANEKEAFVLSETTTLRYGLEPNWVQQTVAPRTFAVGEANNTFFGSDPAPNQLKRIEKLVVSGGGSVSYANVTNFQVTFGDARIVADWTQPTQSGLTGYDLVITRPSGDETIALGLNPNPYTITNNIFNGSNYSVKIRAKYGTNASPYSSIVTGTPQAAVLNPPRNSTATPGNNTINFSFEPPISGSPTSYEIVLRNTSTNAETTTTVAGSGNITSQLSGTNGVQYGVKVRALYGSSPSLYTTEVFATPNAPNATWEFLVNEKVQFTLTETTTVRYGLEPNWIEQTLAPGTYFPNNTMFGGDPAPNQLKRVERLVVTGGGTTSYAAPTNFQATFGNAQVSASWSHPSQSGRTGYDLVISRPSTGDETISLGASVTSHTISNNVNNGSSYSLKIRARYGTNISPFTTSVTGTPQSGTLTNTIGFLGDSNTSQDPYVSDQTRRTAALVGADLGVTNGNYGSGGALTTDFLTTTSMNNWKAGNHKYYIIAFGLNEIGQSVSTAQFKTNTKNLITQVQSIGATPILLTMKHYDFTGGHHNFNRNVGIENYNTIYRQISSEDNIRIIDAYATFKTMNDAFNGGDTTTRSLYGVNYPKWATDRNYELYVANPARPQSDYIEVHYNQYGAKVLAETIAAYFRNNNLIGTAPPPSGGGGTVGSTVTKTFTPHTLDRPNPERGVTHIHMVYSSFGTNQPRPLPTVGSSVRLVQFRYVWHDFLTSDISSSRLQHLIDDLARAREQGVKVIYWPSYWSNGPVYPGMTLQYGGQAAFQARDLGKTDTTEAWIKRHWDQVATILNANKDVIAWVQIGSMGAWGEGNKSSNGLDYDVNNPDAAVKRIFEHVLSKLDVEIKLSGRYVPALRTMFGSAAVTAAEAHTSVTKARIGGWDDFAGSLYGQGDRDWLAAHNLYFPYHGEGVPGSYSYNSIGGVNGLNFFRNQRWTAFQPFGGDFLRTWQEEDVYDDILRGLGYRHALLESRIPASVPRGQTLNVILKLRNDGFANVNNLRRAEIVLRNKANNQYTRLIGITDIRKGTNRFPDPGNTKDCTLSAAIPATLATGNYQVLVNLPDPNFLNPANANERKYSVEIMSTGVYDSATAYNAVGDVTIS
jgi:hypothetical protein